MSWSDDDSEEGRLSFFANPGNWPLFYHTAKNMKARQLAGIAERKARHAVLPRLPIDFDQRYERRIPDNLVVTPLPIAANSDRLRNSLSDAERDRYRNLVQEASEGRLTFLDRSIEFGDEIDWEHELLEEYPLLWRLKLQAFEFLEWAVLGYDKPTEIEDIHSQFQQWLLSWTADNPIGEQKYLRRSWIPHSVSLRIINWCRYASWCERSGIDVNDHLYRQIYKNSLFLENHIEFDIGGNHLIENAIALVMAGALFNDYNTGWSECGAEILENAGETQFVDDGGHFERSPMYHIMTTSRYITAYNILENSGHGGEKIEEVAEKGLGFLSRITGPNHKIPLLNDSVYGEEISATSCLEYGGACSLEPRTVSLNLLSGSGYWKFENDNYELLMDVGPVGPSHLPAHSHNDQLSVLLWINKSPVFTDTGVFDYTPTSRRQYVRSIRAHNTTQYGDLEPIPIAGKYLMGKRSSINILERDEGVISVCHTVNRVLGPKYKHYRKVKRAPHGFDLYDTISSDRGEVCTIRYHLSPEVQISVSKDAVFNITNDDLQLAKIKIDGDCTTDIVKDSYYPEFGKEIYRKTLKITFFSGEVIKTSIHINSENGS